MSAGRLAAKLIVKPRDVTRAVVVRPAGSGGEDPQDPSAPPGGGVDFGGDFGAAPPPAEGGAQEAGEQKPGWETVPGRAPLDVFCHEETAREQVAAAKDTATTTYRLYGELEDGEPPVAEDEYLDVTGEGVINVRGVVRRPTEGLWIADATKTGGG